MRDDGYMRPNFAQGKKAAVAKLLKLRQQAQRDKEPRMMLRIQGILMSLDGHTTGEIADHLRVHRSTVPLWIDQWNRYGKEGLLEGHRSGRPTDLSREDRERLCDILDSGGLRAGNWDLDQSAGASCHRRGIWAAVSRRACTQITSPVGLFGATAPDTIGSG